MEGRLTAITGRVLSLAFQMVVTCSHPSVTRWWFMLSVFTFSLHTSMSFGYQSTNLYRAMVNITYKDPVTNEWASTREEIGRYSPHSRLDAEWGWVVHVRTADNRTHGCSPPVNFLRERWIALVQRGHCKFQEKIHNAAILKNASAVVIYNNLDEKDVAPHYASEYTGKQTLLSWLLWSWPSSSLWPFWISVWGYIVL